MGFQNGGPSQVSGVQVLLERVAKLLTTELGSNSFNPELGSQIGRKQTLTQDNSLELQVLIHSAVDNVSNQIQIEQGDSAAPLTPDQKLLSLEVSSILRGTDPTTWYVEVLVITGANETYFLTV